MSQIGGGRVGAIPVAVSGSNLGVGANALRAVTTGTGNTACGAGAGLSVTTGSNNVVIGLNAMAASATPANCVVVGASSAPSLTGTGNVVIGQNSGGGISSGALNTIVGSGLNGLVNPTGAIILGSNGGIQYDFNYTTPNTHRFTGAVTSTGSVRTRSGPYGALPPPGNAGARNFVTDATQALAAGLGTVVVGGGTNAVPVYDDGTDWRIG